MSKRKRKPLGKPIVWNDADLDALSNITEADIIEAGQWWQQNAPRKFKNLIDAKETDASTQTK